MRISPARSSPRVDLPAWRSMTRVIDGRPSYHVVTGRGGPMAADTPQRRSDSDGDQRRTLEEVERYAARAEQSLVARDGLIRLAHACGNSLREIADAAGLSHMTVKRII